MGVRGSDAIMIEAINKYGILWLNYMNSGNGYCNLPISGLKTMDMKWRNMKALLVHPDGVQLLNHDNYGRQI